MNQIVDNIGSFCTKALKRYSVLSKSQSLRLLQHLADRHNFDISKKYWWEHAGMTVCSLYDGLGHWKKLMNQHLGSLSTNIYLTVTDDEFFPWPVIQVEKEDLIEIITNHEFFEYFVFDDLFNLVLFDAHHNEVCLKSR